VDSTWTPPGIGLAESPAKLWVKFQVESTWTPPGLQMDKVDSMDSTPLHHLIQEVSGLHLDFSGLHMDSNEICYVYFDFVDI
jgi:hypothetical protein